jgi:hypothetical protein
MRNVRARPMVVGSPLAIAWPMVWRTRMLSVLAVGIAVNAVTWVLVAAAPLTRATVPDLASLLWWWTAFDTLAVIGGLFVTVLQVRWARPIFSSRVRIGLMGCCFLSAVAMVFPPHVALHVGSPRLAAVENETVLREEHAFIQAHRFFDCIDENEVEENRARMDKVATRYGFAMRQSYDYECPKGTRSLWIWRVDGIGFQTSARGLEARWETIEAAHQYASGTGPLTSGLRSGWMLAATAGLFAIGAAIVVKPRQRLFSVAGIRLWRAAPLMRWYEATGDRMAARAPALWSSQIHKSVGEALLIVGIFLIASRGYESSRNDASPSIVVGMIVLLVITPALFARRQQCLRTTEPPALHDAVSFVVHFLWFFTMLVASAWIYMREDLFTTFFVWIFGLVLIFSACFSATLAAVFQLGRRLPTLYVLLGFVIAASLLSAGSYAVDTFKAGQPWIIGVGLLIAVSAWLLGRQERWPVLAALSVSAVVPVPAVAWLFLMEKLGISSGDEILQVAIVCISCVAVAVVSILSVRKPARRLGRILG